MKALATVVAFLMILGMIIVLPILSIKIGWYLFVVPVFNLAELTWLQAFGFALLLAPLNANKVSNYKSILSEKK
jgi:membrane protein CcdC involved in cytochrome C biogenesis